MEKEVVCIKSLIYTAFDSVTQRQVILLPNQEVIKGNIYTVTDSDDNYYQLKEKDPKVGYNKVYFRDLVEDDISISEVIEILKQEPCLI